MSIPFAKLVYSSQNLGDDIQTLSTIPFIGEDAVPFDRDSLAIQTGEKKYLLIMNGWWADHPETAFPPAPCFVPIFIGFHIARKHESYFTSNACLAYFKIHQPIGCRDESTMQLLQSHGVMAFFSGCLTTTFNRRSSPTEEKIVCLVDTQLVDHLIPAHIKRNARNVSHSYEGPRHERERTVSQLMQLYQHQASLVITTRLHAALTCSALGIPVVFFFDSKDPRASTANQIGLRMYNSIHPIPNWMKVLFATKAKDIWLYLEKRRMKLKYRMFGHINWNPEPIDFEEHKNQLRQITKEMISQRNV